MMAKLVFSIVVLLLVQYASTQTTVDRKSDASEVQDPVAKLLTELGLLILDVDGAFSEHTAPKVEFEDRMKEQMYGRPRSEYFNRIRDNYRILQRIGSLGIKDDLSVSSKLFGVNVKNEGQTSSVDVSVPSLSVLLQARSKVPSVTEPNSKKSHDAEGSTRGRPEGIYSPESRLATKIKVGNSEVKIDSAFTLPDISSQDEMQGGYLIVLGDPGEAGKAQRGKRTPLIERASDEVVNLFISSYREFLSNPDIGPEDFEAKSMDTMEKGRILGDVVYSESTFDKLTKNILKNTKWIVDSDLSPSKVFDKLDEISKLITHRRPSKLVSEKDSLEVNSKIDAEPTRGLFKRDAPTDSAEPINHDVPHTESSRNETKMGQMQSTKDVRIETKPPKETILLALTNNGVPVKLRIGPEVGNPIRFLHRILSAAEVTLSIEMKPKDSVKPTEKKEPQLESGNGGIKSPALEVDLSNFKERGSFLRTLRKFKPNPH